MKEAKKAVDYIHEHFDENNSYSYAVAHDIRYFRIERCIWGTVSEKILSDFQIRLHTEFIIHENFVHYKASLGDDGLITRNVFTLSDFLLKIKKEKRDE